MGWGTDEVVGGWGADQSIDSASLEMEAIKRRNREINRESARQAFQQSPWYERLPMQAAIGATKGTFDILSLANRAVSQVPGMPEGMGQFSDEVNTAFSENDSTGGRFADESVQGAARSLSKAIPIGGMGGGLYGVIAEAGLTAANQAYTKARRAGKSHNAALAYATTSGAIEAGITAALPGQSKLIAENKGLLGGVKGWITRQLGGIAAEYPQEAAIGYGQALADVGFGVDRTALSPEARNQMARSIIGQVAVAGGAIGAAQAAIPADTALVQQAARAERAAAKPSIEARRAAYTSPENVASVLRSAREAGNAAGLEALAAKPQPTRKDWDSAGLPSDMGKSADTRAKFASGLKEAITTGPLPLDEMQRGALFGATPLTPEPESTAAADAARLQRLNKTPLGRIQLWMEHNDPSNPLWPEYERMFQEEAARAAGSTEAPVQPAPIEQVSPIEEADVAIGREERRRSAQRLAESLGSPMFEAERGVLAADATLPPVAEPTQPATPQETDYVALAQEMGRDRERRQRLGLETPLIAKEDVANSLNDRLKSGSVKLVSPRTGSKRTITGMVDASQPIRTKSGDLIRLQDIIDGKWNVEYTPYKESARAQPVPVPPVEAAPQAAVAAEQAPATQATPKPARGRKAQQADTLPDDPAKIQAELTALDRWLSDADGTEKDYDSKSIRSQLLTAKLNKLSAWREGGSTVSAKVQSGLNRTTTSADALANLVVIHPRLEQGYGSLDVPAKRMVMKDVGTLLHNLKIFRSVVSSLPVSVMNYLPRGKRSAEHLLSEPAVLINYLSANIDSPVATWVANELGRLSALRRAETKNPDVGRPLGESLSTVGATNLKPPASLEDAVASTAAKAPGLASGTGLEGIEPVSANLALLHKRPPVAKDYSHSDRIREDEGQVRGGVPQEGIQPGGGIEEGQNQGGQNLQQPAPGESGRQASLTESPDVLRITPSIHTGGLTNLASAIKSGFQKFLTSRGNLPKDAFDKALAKNAKVAAELRKMAYTGNALRDALIQEQGSNKLSVEGQQRVDAALHGDQAALAALPRKVRESVAKMRDHIDYLSRRLIDSGMAEGQLELTIDENMGTYATRSYQVFDDPDWANKVSPEVRNKAKAFIRAEMPDASDLELTNMIGDLLYKGDKSPIALIKQGKLGSKDLSILKKRKDIPPEIRALLGEYKDPFVNYSRSVTKMAHLLANHEFLTTVRKEGLGQYLFEQDDPNRPAGHNAPIASEGSKAMKPLNGLMTTPEIAKAFQEQFADTVQAQGTIGWLIRLMYQGTGLAKAAKTIGNFPMGYVRNFAANAETLFANGNLGYVPQFFAKAVKLTAQDVRADLPDFARVWFGTDEALQKEFVEEYIQNHVVDESVHANELREYVKDALINGPAEATNNALVQAARKGGQAASSVYQAMDNVWRIINYHAEKSKYRQAYPEWSEDQLRAKASEITRNTFHTYSMIPSAIKTLRRVPFIAPFVSFTAETIRTKYNSFALAKQELETPETREIGAKRLAGNVAALSIVPAAMAAVRFILGVTGDDDDDLRRFAPPWSRNADILHLPSGDDPTKRKWVDVSYSSPSAYFRRPITAFLRGDDWESSFTDAAKEILEPFFGEELLFEKVADVIRNKDGSSGSPITGPVDTLAESTAKNVGHVAEAFKPGSVSVAERNYKAWTGHVEPSGRTYDKTTEALAPITGMRIQDTDIAQGLVFAARRFNATRPDITSLFVKTFSGPGTTTPENVKATYIDADQKARRHFEDMRETVRAAIRLGLEPEKAYQSLVAGGVSNDLASQIISGEYMPYKVSSTVLGRLEGLPDADERFKAYAEAYDQVQP